ncbi:MAG: hypothetical protein AB7U63_13555 [Porticoccaceae bacterium]
MNNEMSPYKDLGDICDPTDQEYDPLTGSWVPQEPGFDWPLTLTLAAGCIAAILLMVWL